MGMSPSLAEIRKDHCKISNDQLAILNERPEESAFLFPLTIDH
jgi:hypothetical protein